MVKIAVLGAGINGLTCAVKIKEKYKNFHVTLISSEFTPNTTGDGSGGLWYPYLYGNTPSRLIEKWGGETYEFLQDLWKSGGFDVCLMPIYNLYRKEEQCRKPDWVNIVYGYQELNSKQLEHFSRLYSARYVAGQTFTTFISSPPVLLAYLQQRFERANGKILQAKLTSLKDPLLSEYDVVVNCTGMGARDLVPDDKVVPIRGQLVKVEAPWINETIVDETSGNYIIPNAHTCVLGGTHQNEFNTEVDPNDTDFILNGCKELIPGLEEELFMNHLFQHAKIVKHSVGLRPGRDSIRLEPEERDGRLYIHNYGHGGSGLTLFWGCGNEVLQIFETYLNKKHLSLKMSKL